ncbi:hypothetical protein J6590_056163 [Homalodisca vitripennis]|nr:hypothetical protein J6590_056163 [Homalodisca vitripennis]
MAVSIVDEKCINPSLTSWKCSIFSEYRREHSHTVAAQQTAVRVSLVPYNPNNPPPRASN